MPRGEPEDGEDWQPDAEPETAKQPKRLLSIQPFEAQTFESGGPYWTPVRVVGIQIDEDDQAEFVVIFYDENGTMMPGVVSVVAEKGAAATP